MPGIRYPLLSILAKEMCLELSLLLAPAQARASFPRRRLSRARRERDDLTGLDVIQRLGLAHRLSCQQDGLLVCPLRAWGRPR